MRRIRTSARTRRPIVVGLSAFALALTLPTLVWLSFPAPAVPVVIVPTATPQIVRVGGAIDAPIPADWQPPNLHPELEAAALAIPDTLPLSETASLATPTAITTITWAVAAPGLVASAALNLRDGPGGRYLALQVLPQTTSITVVGRYAGWYQVVAPDGIVGWVDGDFVATNVISTSLPLVESVPDPAPALLATLHTDAANLRSGPARAYAALAVLTPNDGDVTLLTRRAGWYNVRTEDAREGWIAAELLTTSPYIARRVPVLTAAPAALEAVRMARTYIGYEYVWGGATPRQGFDCSGLVMYVYGKLGVELPHGSIEQWNSGIGTRITRQRDLQPGDIVYFKNTYRRGISHVGIYAGNRLIVQAISENVGISVSSLDDEFWSSRYVGALRMFE